MSRVGKNPIKIESGVTVTAEQGGDYNHIVVKVKGPKGELSQALRKGINVEIKPEEIVVTRENETRQVRSLHGLYRTLIANMVSGVTEGFSKELEIVGVGYKGVMKGNDLELSVGFTHPVLFKAPEGIKFEVADNVDIKVSGIDKELVGTIAAKIRAVKKPEPYKGKGIRYKGEMVRRKAGKTAASAS